MIIFLVEVKDQFNQKYSVKGTFHHSITEITKSKENIKFITIDNENIKPSFDLHFHSIDSGKIFRLV